MFSPIVSTVLLFSIVSVTVGFSPPTNIGAIARHTRNSPCHLGFRLIKGDTPCRKARRGDDRDGIRLAPSRSRLRPHWAVAIEGVDTKGVEKAPSHDGWGDQSKQDNDVSYSRMLRFIFPTLGIWLASPIMSLVDAGVIGTRSALELASLGPATVLCESLIYCSTFLAVATTNLQATALADRNPAEAQKVVAEALGLALAIGTAIGLGVQLLGPQLLARLAGEKSMEVIPSALMYSRIRILGAPASIAAMVLQAACLGARDSFTPLGVVLVASAVNALGDWWSVCRMNMGVVGAAAATSSAELVSMVLLGTAVWRAQGERLHRFVTLPSRKELGIFLNFAGPIAFALFGKVICYTSMTLVVTSLGTIPLASHNVMMRVFFFFGTFGEALSQTAQAFIPGQLAREREALKVAGVGSDLASASGEARSQTGLTPARTLMRKVLVLSVVVGGLNACVAGLIPLRLPHLFTNSLAVTANMRSLVPLLSWSLLAHALVMGLEGVLLARRRLGFLARCYAVNTAVMIAFLQWVRTWPAARGLHGVWSGLLLFQLLRVGEFSTYFVALNRREAVDAAAAVKRGGATAPADKLEI